MDTLRDLRVRHHLSQRDVARSLGISKVAVHYWETGKTRPSLRYLQPLAALLALSVDALLQTVLRGERR